MFPLKKRPVNLEKTYQAQPWADLKLFAKQAKVYPKRVRGTFRTIKWVFLAVLLGIYYLTPWIRWDRGPNSPDQAVLLDVPGRKFYFFNIEIWPQEIILLTGILFMGAIGLFLVTSLFGRIWCAWGCPQTVWTDLFVLVERWIEGDRNARIKLEKASWSWDKFRKRALKHLIWVIIAMLTGGAWVFYFNDTPTLMGQLFKMNAPVVAYTWIGILTASTYLLAGHAREQVCVYMCPYSRFQSVMLELESVIVTYRSERGEPRKKHKKGTSWKGRGHCIDCTQCISVCPMGIDIRDGVQIACINCGLCADACDNVMDMVGLPRGLIAFDSAANVERRARGEPSRLHIFRPRTFVYLTALAVAGGFFFYNLANRSLVEMNILKDRNPVFVTLSNGDIRNTFTVHILNKYHENKTYLLTIEGITAGGYWLDGEGESMSVPVALNIGADQVHAYRIFVRFDGAVLSEASTPLTFSLTEAGNGETVSKVTPFLGPGKE